MHITGEVQSNLEQGMVAHAYNTGTQDAEVGRVQVSGQPGLHINTLSQGGRKLVGGKEGRGKEEGREGKKRENMISSHLPGFGLLETVSIAGSNRRKTETRTFIVAVVCWCCCCLKMVWIVTT